MSIECLVCAAIGAVASGIYATFLFRSIRIPDEIEAQIRGCHYRCEQNELHWDSTYSKIRNVMNKLAMREGRRQKKEVNFSNTSTGLHEGETPAAESTPSAVPSREELWRLMHELEQESA